MVSPQHTTTYTATASGPEGNSSEKITINVTDSIISLPTDSFGKQYEDLIPSDVTIGEYEPQRFSVIVGQVFDFNTNPIDDVIISVHNHPEYGTVRTNIDGMFHLPIEGGKSHRIEYQKIGYNTIHRIIDVPANDFATVQDVTLSTLEEKSTHFVFNGNPNTIVQHQSNLISDHNGSRSLTIITTGDNTGYIQDKNGNDIQQISAGRLRISEYTTPQSMPAELPPSSAFTYCAELSVDGAERIRFDKPVVSWLDNFLEFSVGMIVPVGSYDRDKGIWLPGPNGIVVKLLDTDADGIVDSLDADGDDRPDDLDQNGQVTNEVLGLDDPIKYSPDSTFWRFETKHFTPFDLNWPTGRPADAIDPNASGTASSGSPGGQSGVDPCTTAISSYVEDRSRIFHEDIPVPGTDLTLHYSSERVDGNRFRIDVPVSGETVPASLKRIEARLSVAGRIFSQTLPASPNQMTSFEWDGLDVLGRPVKVEANAVVSVGFVYDEVYYVPKSLNPSFGAPGGAPTGIKARRETTLWKQQELKLNILKGNDDYMVAEGWTLSNHHLHSFISGHTLFKGDGSIIDRRNEQVITTIAGTGVAGYSGDGGPATEAQLNYPVTVTIGPDGDIYIADKLNNRVRSIDENGIISTFAGNGLVYPNSYLPKPATDSMIATPHELIFDVDGNAYVSTYDRKKVLRIDPQGMLHWYAGNGHWGNGYPGSQQDMERDKYVEGGVASKVGIGRLYGLASDGRGNIFIATSLLANESRVLKVDGNNIITTALGDFGCNLHDVAFDSQGDLIITTSNCREIKKFTRNGELIHTAGKSGGYDPNQYNDGIPALDAQMGNYTTIDFDRNDNLLIANNDYHSIRKIDHFGIITTIAGKVGPDEAGYSGDGGPPTLARLNSPQGVVISASGEIIIADTGNNVIRKISTPGIFTPPNQPDYLGFIDRDGTGHIISNNGLHVKTIDMDTGVVLKAFVYDHNRLTAIIDRFGNETIIERDSSGKVTAIVSPDGLRTLLTIDANNHLDRVEYEDGGYYEFDYTQNGLMTSEIEPNGNRFDHRYDAFGKIEDVFDQEGGHWHFSQNVQPSGQVNLNISTAEGNVSVYEDRLESGKFLSTITNSAGAQAFYEQSADGLTVNRDLSCGMAVKTEYGADPKYHTKSIRKITELTPSNLQRIINKDRLYTDTDFDGRTDLINDAFDVNGNTFLLEKDLIDSTLTATTAEGRTVNTTYDPSTLLTRSISIPGYFDYTFQYDSSGRLQYVNSGARQMEFLYDGQGFLDTIIDPENKATSFEYDAVGRVKAVHRPDTTDIYYDYDANGNMTILTNPVPADHGFGYNKVNLSDSYDTPSSGSYSFEYDRDRRPTTTRFPSGKIIRNVYESGLNRVDFIETPEGNIDFTYLCGSKVDTITKGEESISFEYDGKLLSSETYAGTINQTLSYQYNNDFKVQTFSYAGDTEILEYDNDGLLIGSGNFTITRNTGNGLAETLSDNTFSLSRAFNGYGEINNWTTSIDGLALYSNVITLRDNTGRITQRTESVNGIDRYFTYTYDDMGRLLTVTLDGNLVEEYRYDPNGTRTYEMNQRKGINTPRTLSYSEEDHLLQAGAVSYQHDVDGFLTTKTDGTEITTYNYSSRGELLGVNLPDGTTIEYIHDPLGRRIAKKVNDTITEKYLWQGLTKLLAVYDSADNLLMRFEYADDRTPVSMLAGGVKYYLIYDQVGSLRMVADSSGAVIKEMDYDTFGYILNDTNPSFTIPFGFAGGLHDRDTGLIRFGYRDYDPDKGRWTAKDPILFYGEDTDLYGYVFNNPVNLIDPYGLLKVNIGGSGIGVDISTTLYDSNTGWFQDATGSSSVSTTLVGGGVQIVFDTSFNPIASDLLVSFGVLSKYLGFTYDPGLSQFSVNLGLGLGLPISFSTSMDNFINWFLGCGSN